MKILRIDKFPSQGFCEEPAMNSTQELGLPVSLAG